MSDDRQDERTAGLSLRDLIEIIIAVIWTPILFNAASSLGPGVPWRLCVIGGGGIGWAWSFICHRDKPTYPLAPIIILTNIIGWFMLSSDGRNPWTVFVTLAGMTGMSLATYSLDRWLRSRKKGGADGEG